MKTRRLGTHRYTVQSRERIYGRVHQYRYVTRPWISLSAKWLEDAGFHEGDSIDIHAYPDALIIVKPGQLPFWHRESGE